MKCDRCGKPSVYHSTLIVNGVSQTTNLCRDCAIKEGVFNTSPASVFDDFDDMFSLFTDFLPDKTADIVCPVCKTSLSQFRSTHKLGCPNCYEVFKNEVNAVLKRLAPFDSHKPEISQTSEQTKQSAKAKKPTTKAEKIAALREEMATAVREERYEDAGKIKKQIAALEAENE